MNEVLRSRENNRSNILCETVIWVCIGAGSTGTPDISVKTGVGERVH